MSGKLNQSLEEILKDKRSSATSATRGGRGGRPRRGVKPTQIAAPAGGIKKNTKPARGAVKQAPAKGVKGSRGSMIQIGNLPRDVSENQIKEYFTGLNKQGFVGDVKKVECQYGPPPASVPKGVVQVTFIQSDAAYRALSRLQGVEIDKRPLDLKVLVTGDAVPEPPSLSQRITNAPKSAAATKTGAKNAKPVSGAKPTPAARGAAGKKGRGGKPKSARPAKKTAEELDAEMVDYFDSAAQNTTEASGAAAATNGDAQMEDEIM